MDSRYLPSLLCLVMVLAGGCSLPPQSTALLQQQTPTFLSTAHDIAPLPFFPQEDYQCGPAALATVLAASHVDVLPADLVPLVYVPARQGSFQVELVAAARSYGRLAYTLTPTLEALFAEIRSGNPVVVLQNLGLTWYPQWHYAVVKGFDLAQQRVRLNSGVHEDYDMALGTFERTWARAGHWALVVLDPGLLPAMPQAPPYFSAAVALENAGHPAAAERAYASGLAQWPTDRNLLLAYGNRLYDKGELQAAADQFSVAVQLHPDHAPAHNNLAQALFELGDRTQALAHARRAVALGGDNLATARATLSAIQDGP